MNANGGSRYIAPGQAFYIHSNTYGATFRLGPDARTHGDGASLKSAAFIDDVLRLTLSNATVQDEQVLVFREIGSDSFSSFYDSEKRFTAGNAEVSLYTKKSNRSIIINALPEEGMADRVVPLYINVGAAGAGSMTLRATNIERFKSDVPVYLTDKESGVTINLREMPEYLFTIGKVSALNRFELTFGNKQQIPTDIEDAQTQKVRITAYNNDGKGIVTVTDAGFKGNVKIELFDLFGRLLSTTRSDDSRSEISLPATTEMVILRVEYQDKVKTFKLVANP